MSRDRCRLFAFAFALGLALDWILVIGLSVVVVSHRAIYEHEVRVVVVVFGT